MRSKRFKGIMAVVLALACVLPMPVSGQTAGDTGKIDEYLLEKMEQYTGELPVYIWAKVDVDADVNDFVDAMDEQEFAQIVKEFRQSIGLEEDNFVFNEKYMYKMKRTFMTNTAPLTTAWLTKDEILALALEGNERILGIEYVPERGNTINYVPFFVRILSCGKGFAHPAGVGRVGFSYIIRG